MDSSVAITKLDLERAKGEVLFSLIPLLIFIIFVLYAFCRMGVFAVCNPMRMCPNSPDTQVDLPSITPKKLLNYKRGLVAKKNQALAAFQQASGSPGDRPPDPDSGGTGGIAIPGEFPHWWKYFGQFLLNRDTFPGFPAMGDRNPGNVLLTTRNCLNYFYQCWYFSMNFDKIILKQESNYRTRAIISRGLYIFLPHFQRPFVYCDLWPYVWLLIKSGLWWRAYGKYFWISVRKNQSTWSLQNFWDYKNDSFEYQSEQYWNKILSQLIIEGFNEIS